MTLTRPSSATDRPRRRGPAWRRFGLVGGAGLALAFVGAPLSPEAFFRAYLAAYLFWLGVALGALGLLFIQHLTGGYWGAVLRRPLEAAAATLPLLALLFVPLLFGLPYLYPWARPAAVAADPLLQGKSLYLNVPFFIVRAAAYFGLWVTSALLLDRWSQEEDRGADLPPDADPRRRHALFAWSGSGAPGRVRTLSATGLLGGAFSVTFAAIDWAMSLEPHWYSTIYGAMVGGGWLLSGFAFAVLVLLLLRRRRPLVAFVSPRLFNDLGSLQLAFLVIWTYLAFAQFLLIWSANLVEEVPWYLHRLANGWEWVSLTVALLGFAVPFGLLIFRGVKRNPETLLIATVIVLASRVVASYWLVAPALAPTVSVTWLDLAALVGIGGVWLALFAWTLGRRPLLPLHDPRLATPPEGQYG